jgi:P2 family phage major capsid protein
MQELTRKRWNAYVAGLAASNGGVDVAAKFNVTPATQNRLEKKIQDSSEFLKRINVVPVTLQMGQKIGLSMSGPIASRTDTTGAKSRTTRDMSVLDGSNYLCVQTNFDTHLRYDKLDMWAEFPEFASLISAARFERCALDRQMIGFNGTHAAVDTDLVANPKLQDVNKGWLQLAREFAPERVMHEVVAGSNKIKVGGVGYDYKTLDGLAFDMLQLLDPRNREAGDLVIMLGRDLMHDKLFPIVDGQTAPTEMIASSLVVSQKRVANLPAVTPPDFPANAMQITSFKNLSIYYQKQGRRMHVKEAPERDRVETYESSNDAYVIEDFGKYTLAENIELAA